MATTSIIDICNIALGYLKGGRITAFDQSSEAARLCEQYYVHACKCVFEEHTWNALMTRVSLSPLTTPPAWGYAYQFPYPNSPECVRLVKIVDASGQDIVDYTTEGNKILTNTNVVNLLYVGNVTDTTQYNEMLVECIARKLAAFLAYNLSETTAYVQMAEDMYHKVIEEARSLDDTQGAKGASYADPRIVYNLTM